MARQTEQQKKNQAQRNRDLLLASLIYRNYGPGDTVSKTLINDGDPSTYDVDMNTATPSKPAKRKRIGPGPERPFGWVGDPRFGGKYTNTEEIPYTRYLRERLQIKELERKGINPLRHMRATYE